MKIITTVTSASGPSGHPYSEEVLPKIGAIDTRNMTVSVGRKTLSCQTVMGESERIVPFCRSVRTPEFHGAYELRCREIPAALVTEGRQIIAAKDGSEKWFTGFAEWESRAVRTVLATVGFADWQIAGLLRGATASAYQVPENLPVLA